uniref:(California timema) hypothetical protein n=1 Tax=Timema californicum TaxID=61474 RepID=A0A7R9JDA2_TIMCA|nr:unnamed protein product [Timema californicum]
MDAVKLKFQIFETHLKNFWQERNLNRSQVAEEEASICNQFRLLFESIEENQLLLLNKHKLLCLRQKIEEAWTKTYASDEVKMNFTDFRLDYTEALLSTHQAYLDALQKYHSTNQTLFKELDLLIQLQNKFEASQLLVLDSTRLFRNRGGALLKEEKDRQLTKKVFFALSNDNTTGYAENICSQVSAHNWCRYLHMRIPTFMDGTNAHSTSYLLGVLIVLDACYLEERHVVAGSVPTSVTGMWKEGVEATVANSQVAE